MALVVVFILHKVEELYYNIGVIALRICTVDGCDEKHVACGYCKDHYRSYNKYGDPLQIQKRKAERKAEKEASKKTGKRMSRNGICSVEGCGNSIKSRGLCDMHYARWRRTGCLNTKTIGRNSISTCLAIGCNKPFKTKGYCSYHYQNLLEVGSPVKPKTVKLCGVKGCEEQHLARGYCRYHYQEWQKTLRDHHLIRDDNEDERRSRTS